MDADYLNGPTMVIPMEIYVKVISCKVNRAVAWHGKRTRLTAMLPLALAWQAKRMHPIV